MASFEYKGYDRGSGRSVKGWLDAPSAKEARRRLLDRGVLAESLTPSNGSGGAGGERERWTSVDRSTLYESLGRLLAAGLTLEDALLLMMDAPENARQRRSLAFCLDRIREGASLADAVREGLPGAGDYEIAVLASGERTGRLSEVCIELGAFYLHQAQVFDKTKTALLYPLLVMVVAFAVVWFMLFFLQHTMAQLWMESGQPLPALTRGMLAFGRVFNVLVAPLGLLALAAWILRRYWRWPAAVKTFWDLRCFSIPLLGRQQEYLVNLRFVRTLQLLLSGGMRLEEALTPAGRATGNAWICRRVEEEAERIRHGASAADALRRIPPLARHLPGWIAGGLAGGNLRELLDHAAKRLEGQWSQSVERSVRIIEPLMIVLIGLLVLLLALAMILPLLALNRGLA